MKIHISKPWLIWLCMHRGIVVDVQVIIKNKVFVLKKFRHDYFTRNSKWFLTLSSMAGTTMVGATMVKVISKDAPLLKSLLYQIWWESVTRIKRSEDMCTSSVKVLNFYILYYFIIYTVSDLIVSQHLLISHHPIIPHLKGTLKK